MTRDAEDAVRGRDGYVFDGCKIRVEFPRSSGRGRGGGGNMGGRRPGGRGNRPKGYQLEITGLPSSGSWQDIKVYFETKCCCFYIYYYNVRIIFVKLVMSYMLMFNVMEWELLSLLGMNTQRELFEI